MKLRITRTGTIRGLWHDAVELLRGRGIQTGIVTAEDTRLVERRAAKIRADHLHQIRRLSIRPIEGSGQLDARLDSIEDRQHVLTLEGLSRGQRVENTQVVELSPDVAVARAVDDVLRGIELNAERSHELGLVRLARQGILDVL